MGRWRVSFILAFHRAKFDLDDEIMLLDGVIERHKSALAKIFYAQQ
jgi:hypothetical protein